jgi:hypothetical protein
VPTLKIHSHSIDLFHTEHFIMTAATFSLILVLFSFVNCEKFSASSAMEKLAKDEETLIEKFEDLLGAFKAQCDYLTKY